MGELHRVNTQEGTPPEFERPPPYAPGGVGIDLLPPYTSVCVDSAASIKGRVNELKLENLKEREIGLLTRILILIARIFTSKYSTFYKDFEVLKTSVQNDRNIDESITISLQNFSSPPFSSLKDDFVEEFARRCIQQDNLQKAEQLLEMHSNLNSPKALYLRAAILELKMQEANKNGKEIVDKTEILKIANKPITLGDITSLNLEELEVLCSNKIDKKWFERNVRSENKHDKILALYIRSGGLREEWQKAKGESDWSPFVWAAQNGHTESVKAIIAISKESNQLLNALSAKNPDRFKDSRYSRDKSALHEAAGNGHTESVKAILDAAEGEGYLREVLIAQNDDKETSIFEAVRNGHTESVQAILEAAKSLNIHLYMLNSTSYSISETPLIIAAKNGDTATVNALLDVAKMENASVNLKRVLGANDTDKYTPITAAASNQHEDVIIAIINALQGDIGNMRMVLMSEYKTLSPFSTIPSTLITVLKTKHTNLVNPILREAQTAGCLKEVLLAEDYDHNTPLFMALKNGETESVKEIIEAAKKAKTEILKNMLTHFVYCNIKDNNKGYKSVGSCSPLQLATYMGDAESVKAIIDGAKTAGILEMVLSHVNGGEQLTSLAIAVKMGHQDIIKILQDAVRKR